MSTRKTDPLLLAGRILTLIMQGFMAIAGLALAIAIPFVIFMRDKINSELIAEKGPDVLPFPTLQIALLMLLALGAVYLVFRFFGNLRKIIATVGEGDPFVPENADRLTQMAWLLTGVYGFAIAMGLVAISVAKWAKTMGETDFHFATGFDLSAILTIIILFILARVFRKGTEMREDLEGTV